MGTTRQEPSKAVETSRAVSQADAWTVKTIALVLVVEILLLVGDVIFNYWGLIDDDGVREIFNVARELSIPNWFSSVQEAALGVVFWLIHLKTRADPARTRAARGWAVAAAAFVYVGLDDGTQLHERVSTAVSYFFTYTSGGGATHVAPVGWFERIVAGFPSYAWQVVFGPVFLALGLFLTVFLWRNLDRRSVLVVYAGFALLAIAQGQDFMEGLETPYERITAALSLDAYTVPHFFKMAEEYLEMLGTTLVLFVALREYARLDRLSRLPARTDG